MPISDLCTRDVVFATRATAVVAAAQLMRQHHVGDLVVVDERAGARVPVGILTDRDLVVEVLAEGVPVDTVTIGDIMSADLVTANETDGVYEVIQKMRAKGVRRMPIVNAGGELAGVIAVDDLLDLMAEEITSLVRVVSRERAREQTRRA